jgi:hypothetical protein
MKLAAISEIISDILRLGAGSEFILGLQRVGNVLVEPWSRYHSLKSLPFLHAPFFMFRLGHGVGGVLSVRMGIMEGRPQGRMAENQFAMSSLTAWREQPLSVFIGWL